MKHLIFTILAICTFNISYSQCIPDSISHHYTGIRPTQLPNAKANNPYNQTIQFKFPKDTTVSVSGFPINATITSIVIKNVKNLPKTMTYACSNSNCTYAGGAYGCISITGTPLDGDVGTDSLNVILVINANYMGAPISANDSGKVGLIIDAGSGIFFGGSNAITSFQNYPNPFSTSTEIQFSATSVQTAIFKVSNELGQQVYNRNLAPNTGLNTISFERNNLPAGIYLYSIQMGNDVVTRRMVIKD